MFHPKFTLSRDLKTESDGKPRSLMSATDLAQHDDDDLDDDADDDYNDDDDDDNDVDNDDGHDNDDDSDDDAVTDAAAADDYDGNIGGWFVL